MAQSLISLASEGDVQPLKNDRGNDVIVRDLLNFFFDFLPPVVPFLGFLVGVLLFEPFRLSLFLSPEKLEKGEF